MKPPLLSPARPAALALVGLATFAAGCGLQREPNVYADETMAIVETKTADIKRCYDGVLKSDETAAGTVTVFFVVEKDTGTFKSVEVKESSVPPPVQACIEGAFDGLVLTPPDANDGHATVTVTFEVGPKPPRPPAPAAAPADAGAS